MSDRRPTKSQDSDPNGKMEDGVNPSMPMGTDPLELIEQCLASFPDSDPRQKILYKLRHAVTLGQAAQQQREVEFKKVADVIAKLTAPANRVGTLLEVPGEGLARILVGGAEYYAAVDPRLPAAELKIGAQILVNEAYAVIKILGYDRNGPVLRVAEALVDGRLRFEQEMGRQVLILQRSSDLIGVDLKAGDEVRIEPSLHVAIEKLEDRKAKSHLLDERPTVTWEQIGGQTEAIAAIQKAIEYPLLHAETFQRFKFTQPKGFLLHGPPGCGKTLIGQAAANSLSKLMGESGQPASNAKGDKMPVTRGAFLHVKGPEILNMWLGESERMVRDLFAQARARRNEGALPFIFIDEAESVLGTRRASRSFNISSTLVPMFCSEMDGIESLHVVVLILASIRPDLIDPAVLRPGRMDCKVKVSRPDKDGAREIYRIYLTDNLPYDGVLAKEADGLGASIERLIERFVDWQFTRRDENKFLEVTLRSGRKETLYRSDLISGAIIASIVERAKAMAIKRAIATDQEQGIRETDLQLAFNAEYVENDIFPTTDITEDWLKLIDYDPENVVKISPIRPTSDSAKRPSGVI